MHVVAEINVVRSVNSDSNGKREDSAGRGATVTDLCGSSADDRGDRAAARQSVNQRAVEVDIELARGVDRYVPHATILAPSDCADDPSRGDFAEIPGRDENVAGGVDCKPHR